MYPYIHIILPSYSVMAFIGAFFSLVFLYLRLGKFQVEFTVFLKLFVLCSIGGFAGSKLLFATTQLPWLAKNFSLQNLLLLVPQSGYVFYGGLFGVLFTIFCFTKKNPTLRKQLFALIAPAIPLFHSFGRVGCLLAGCCYGRVLRIPLVLWGTVEFQRIPVQIIEASYELLLFLAFLALEKAKPQCDLLKTYLIAYAAFRFGIEFFRGDEARGIFFGLSTAQWISIAIITYYVLLEHPQT